MKIVILSLFERTRYNIHAPLIFLCHFSFLFLIFFFCFFVFFFCFNIRTSLFTNRRRKSKSTKKRKRFFRSIDVHDSVHFVFKRLDGLSNSMLYSIDMGSIDLIFLFLSSHLFIAFSMLLLRLIVNFFYEDKWGGRMAKLLGVVLATTILLFRGGRTTPKGHGGGK
jgi:hypothetical protein